MVTVDTLIHARWIIPVEPAQQILEKHSVIVDQGKIIGLLPQEETSLRYSARKQIELPHHVLIPGLVNLHTHVAMNLMRGLADDLPLMSWLNDHIWPAETKHVAKQFVYDGALLACAEMLRGGVTCFNDMYFFPEEVARAALQTKMRAVLGIMTIDFPSAYASDAEDYLIKGLAMRDELRHEPLLSFCMAPHSPYTVSDKVLKKTVTLAEKLDLPIHIHVHETQDEIQGSLKQYQIRPLERLNRLGLLSPHLIAVHAVHLNENEIDIFAQRGCSVAHCPSSNLKLASGFAPISGLLDAGVNVGLGTDGAASNNRLDVFTEMRQAALLAKAVSGRADSVPANIALAMATLNAAKALGLDHVIGSIKPGKAADLCALNFSDITLQPCYDPLSHLVYVAGREQVSHVWINGELLLNEMQLQGIARSELETRALFWQNKLASKGVKE